MKKGVSLSIETTIVIILAIIVLVVLLGFLFNVVPPAQTQLQAQATVTRLCGNYIREHPKCDVADVDQELSDACKILGHKACGSLDDVSCITTCCRDFCSGRTTTTKSTTTTKT